MYEKKKQPTGQHDPTRPSSPYRTQLCPWATIWPDISPRPTSPAHALRYCSKLGQEKLKWLNIKKVTSDKVKILCASRHFSLHWLTAFQALCIDFTKQWLTIIFLCYTVLYYILQYDIVHPQHNQKRNTNLILFSFYYPFIFYTSNPSKQLNNPINKNQQFQFYLIKYHLTMKQNLKIFIDSKCMRKNTTTNTRIMYISISQ